MLIRHLIVVFFINLNVEFRNLNRLFAQYLVLDEEKRTNKSYSLIYMKKIPFYLTYIF